jgi:hypothetical protein
MEQHEITQLKARIEDLCQNLASVAEHKDFTELLQIIHRPGWTTIAEAMLISGVVDIMHTHTQTLARLKQLLLTGSRAVAMAPGPGSRGSAASFNNSGLGRPQVELATVLEAQVGLAPILEAEVGPQY